jgi:peptidoglycan hydrolase CwlO-like protein
MGSQEEYTDIFFKRIHETITNIINEDATNPFNQVDNQIQKMQAICGTLNSKVDRMDTKVDRLDAKVERLFAKVDRLGGRLDARFDKLNAKVDAEFATLIGVMLSILVKLDNRG